MILKLELLADEEEGFPMSHLQHVVTMIKECMERLIADNMTLIITREAFRGTDCKGKRRAYLMINTDNITLSKME